MKITKNIIPFIKNHYKILLIIFLVAGIFYWFQWRPSHIRTGCEAYIYRVNQPAQYSMTQLNFAYNACLHQHGM